MHSFKLSTLIPFILLSGITTIETMTASASLTKEIRMFFNNDCSGANGQPFWVCKGMSSGGCCTNYNNPAASIEVFPSGGIALTQGWTNEGCTGVLKQDPTGGCLRPNFAVFSGKWIVTPNLARRHHAVSRTTEPPANGTECTQVNAVGYFDEVTKEIITYMIPEEKRDILMEAVPRGDIETVKAHAPSNVIAEMVTNA